MNGLDSFIVGLLTGSLTFFLFDFIDYVYFDHFLRKRVFPKNKSIIVLDDEETWGSNAFYIKVSDEEFDRLMDGESVREVVDDETKWRTL